VFLRFTDWLIQISIKAKDIDNGTDTKKEIISSCDFVKIENKIIT